VCSGIRFPQRREVTKQGALLLVVPPPGGETEGRGESAAQVERCHEEKVVGSVLGVPQLPLAVTIGYPARGKDKESPQAFVQVSSRIDRSLQQL